VETDKVPWREIDSILAPAGYVATLTNGLNTFWFPTGSVPPASSEAVCARFPSYSPCS